MSDPSKIKPMIIIGKALFFLFDCYLIECLFIVNSVPIRSRTSWYRSLGLGGAIENVYSLFHQS